MKDVLIPAFLKKKGKSERPRENFFLILLRSLSINLMETLAGRNLVSPGHLVGFTVRNHVGIALIFSSLIPSSF